MKLLIEGRPILENIGSYSVPPPHGSDLCFNNLCFKFFDRVENLIFFIFYFFENLILICIVFS